MPKKITYQNSGVDIDAGNQLVERIKPLIKTTARKEVWGDLGGFGGLFRLDTGKFKSPVLVSSTDGVGTKLMIAQMMNKHDTIGIDLVAMSANDVVVHGAEPLFFLDYIATGKINPEITVNIIQGIVKGCREAGCALIGGETAEMPGLYDFDQYDLAGFCVGVVESDKIVDGSGIRPDDRIIGIGSSGIHSNGLSLARKVFFDKCALSTDERFEDLELSLGLELLRPTKIYVKSILNLLKNFNVKGIIHITGGGFIDNIPRILPSPCRAVILRNTWDIPPIFSYIQKMGDVDESEMYRVFNMGIGMMVVVPEKEAVDVREHLERLGERPYAIGYIEKRDKAQSAIAMV